MQREPVPCDRCGATILREGFERPLTIQFVDEDGDEDADGLTFHEELRTLCAACEDDLRAWIDGDAPDRSNAVDLPDRMVAGTALRRTAERLQRVADTLESDLDRGGEADTDA